MAKRNGAWRGDYRKHGQSRRRSWKGVKQHLYDIDNDFGIALDDRRTTRTTFTDFGVTVWVHKSPYHVGYFGNVMNSDRGDEENFEIETSDLEELKAAIRVWIADKFFHSNTRVICPNCAGPAIEVGTLQGIDCPLCGHITARQLFTLMAQIMRRQAEEAKSES